MIPLNISGRLLLVEDCLDTQDLLRLLLKDIDIEFEVANNGEIALQKFEENFDLILMDIEMPVMDGHTASRLLREKGFEKPIVAFTAGSLDKATSSLAERIEYTDCINKPFKHEDLYKLLNRYMGKGEPSPSENISRISSTLEEDISLAPAILQFIKGLPKRIYDIEAAALETDWVDLQHLAHKLMGAGCFGFENLSKLARELKLSAKDCDEKRCLTSILKIKKHCLQIEKSKEYVKSLVK